MLPPGEYELAAHTEVSEILNPETRRVRLTETKLDYDLGTLRLYPHVSLHSKIKDAKQRGEWGDYTKSFGKLPPPWHVVAARGISEETKPSDLKGKWTLIYFFNCDCVYCLATGLPRTAAFFESNREKRARFEIIGFCIDDLGDLSTLKKLEHKLQPLVKNVWKGKDLPFPLLLDNSLTTWKTYGFSGFPAEVLIDPHGKLVKGGLKELAEKIGATTPAQ
jgi:thiol-disulfide isomerase/thioredoxin